MVITGIDSKGIGMMKNGMGYGDEINRTELIKISCLCKVVKIEGSPKN